ncbi:uncharacterized protein LOC125877250 [Solanum stenotomum]|uniref:uncharacterized protein LOC125877250 n=1 Tax=Solanum stenotomum TaxID=172797 RepID=UPI0020D05667|nr:uncharacterized protein LOC125877250 [Solanum stenotomum]
MTSFLNGLIVFWSSGAGELSELCESVYAILTLFVLDNIVGFKPLYLLDYISSFDDHIGNIFSRWQLPDTENSVQASTANDLRRDKYTPINPEKLKAAAMGMSQIAKAFAIATALVFGGSALTFGLAASKLELHNPDDIRTKGKDIVQPRLETFKEQLSPLRIWAEEKSKKWRLEKNEDFKEKPLIKELSKILGAKSSN